MTLNIFSQRFRFQCRQKVYCIAVPWQSKQYPWEGETKSWKQIPHSPHVPQWLLYHTPHPRHQMSVKKKEKTELRRRGRSSRNSLQHRYRHVSPIKDTSKEKSWFFKKSQQRFKKKTVRGERAQWIKQRKIFITSRMRIQKSVVVVCCFSSQNREEVKTWEAPLRDQFYQSDETIREAKKK